MIYTVVSPHASLAQNKITEILKQLAIAPENVTTYDMQEVKVQEALFDVSSAGFLTDKKVVLIKNPYFLTGTPFKGPEHDIEKLLIYIGNPSPENHLIIYAPYEKLDERKKVVKELKKKSSYIKVDSPNEFNLTEYIKNELSSQGITANQTVINEFVQRTKGNVDRLMAELQKIKAFFLQQQNAELTAATLADLVPVTLEDNVFLLTEALTSKNQQRAYQIFSDLMLQKEEPIKLIVMIANQFRLLKQVQTLVANGLSEKDIVSRLAVHPFRVKLARQQARNFTSTELNNRLKQLASIDIQVKTGLIDAELALELLILG